MKRWAVVVVLLYLFMLIALTIPLLEVGFYPGIKISAPEGVLADLGPWQYWVALAVMAVAQAVMLLVPVDLSLGRPTSRRSLLWPILASGLMMGLLGTGLTLSLDEFFRQGNAMTREGALPWAVGLIFWAGWGLIFHRFSRSSAASDLITQQCRYLLKGSILELLVAVPTHIVARARDYCCAGVYTFVGIAFGISVMLFSFGPGVFFLFAARWKRLHPQHAPAAD